MKYLIQLPILVLFIFPVNLPAQDYQFSQFEMAPLYLNPSLAGLMEGNHRLSVKYRDQWNSVIRERSYKTAFVSYDFQICAGNGDFFAFGVSGLYDQVGTNVYRTFLGNLNFAYHHKLEEGTYLAMGLQTGTLGYALGGRNFQFDEQFGPSGFDGSLDDFEDFERYRTNNMLDLSTGILFHNTHRNFQVGIAAFHINQPSYSFLGLNQKNDSRVNMRLVFHGSFRVKLRRYDDLIFRPLAMVQQLVPSVLYWQFIPAVQWHHRIPSVKTGITFGIGARITQNVSTQRLVVDAGILSASLDLEPMTIGLSYEVNLSTLAQASSFRSGPELSFIYMFREKSECVVCKPFH